MISWGQQLEHGAGETSSEGGGASTRLRVPQRGRMMLIRRGARYIG